MMFPPTGRSFYCTPAGPSPVVPLLSEEPKQSDHLERLVREYAHTFSGEPDDSVWEGRTLPINHQITLLRQHLEVTKQSLEDALHGYSWVDEMVQDIALRGMKIAFAMVLLTLDEATDRDENWYGPKAFEAGREFYQKSIVAESLEEESSAQAERLFSAREEDKKLHECRLLYNALCTKLNETGLTSTKFPLHTDKRKLTRSPPNGHLGMKV